MVKRSTVLVELTVGVMLGCVVGFVDNRLPRTDYGFWMTVTMVMLIAIVIGLRGGSAVAWRAAATTFAAEATSGTIALWTMVNAPPSEQPAVGPPTPILALAVIALALAGALVAAVLSWFVNALARRP